MRTTIIMDWYVSCGMISTLLNHKNPLVSVYSYLDDGSAILVVMWNIYIHTRDKKEKYIRWVEGWRMEYKSRQEQKEKKEKKSSHHEITSNLNVSYLSVMNNHMHATKHEMKPHRIQKKEEWNQKLDIILIEMCHSYQCQKWNCNRIPDPEESSCLLHVPHYALWSNTNIFYFFFFFAHISNCSLLFSSLT